MELRRRVAALFREKKYERAVEVCDQMLAIKPDLVGPMYNKACALARLGKPDEAISAVAGAVKAGWTGVDHMRGDPDLEALQDREDFKALVEKTRENLRNAPYEKGREIEGVVTKEGFPDGGLRYRLRMSPDATAEKPNRLIVWLHPSGGSMNRTIENGARRLAERGFALMVLTQKSFRGWSEADADRLMKTLPEVGKIDGIDARRPVVFGYSAGGQIGLHLYFEDPGRFTGLILDAAYPIRRTETGYALHPPPEAQTVRKVPIYALVGTKDGGARVWHKAQDEWGGAGVPLTVEYVPGKGHTWLIGKEQFGRILEWLEAVAAGESPSGTVGTPPPAREAEEETEEACDEAK